MCIRDRFDPNLKVVDVRREAEYAEGHLPRALNLPLNEMNDLAKIAQFEDDQNLYVHCAGGYRSVIASSLLKRQGVHNPVSYTHLDVYKRQFLKCTNISFINHLFL